MRKRFFCLGAGTMAHLRWLESFECGVAEIDDDHRELVTNIQSLQEMMEKGELSSCQSLVASFLAAAKAHFTREEAFLARVRFPDLAEHRTQHKDLLSRAERLRCMCESAADREALDECLEDLIAFLLGDIIEADVNFKSYLQDYYP